MSKYNGWTNYETWCVALWIDNDEFSQKHWLDEARDVRNSTLRKGKLGHREHVFQLAKRLKDAHEDDMPDFGIGCVWGDLLTRALANVAWEEVAEHLLAP